MSKQSLKFATDKITFSKNYTEHDYTTKNKSKTSKILSFQDMYLKKFLINLFLTFYFF